MKREIPRSLNSFNKLPNSKRDLTSSLRAMVLFLNRWLYKVTTEKGEMLNMNKYNCTTIYGDSVTGATPLVVREEDTKIVHIVEIRHFEKLVESLSLNKDWIDYPHFKEDGEDRREKERIDFTEQKLQIWTDKGWKKIRRLIRHKVNKKIYGVSTGNGYVEVTEDHSLVGKDINKIKPTELKIKETELLTSFPTEFIERKPIVFQSSKYCEKIKKCTKCENYLPYLEFYPCKTVKSGRKSACKKCDKEKRQKDKGNDTCIYNSWYNYSRSYELTEDEAWIWGLFMGDGSCGKYGSGYKVKNSWAINNNDMDRLERAKKKIEKLEPLFTFKILDTLKSSGAYKLVPLGDIQWIVKKYRMYMYNSEKAKMVPSIVLNAPFNIRKAFFDGYYEADGFKTINNKGWGSKNQISSQCLFYLAKSINHKFINIRHNQQKNFFTMHSCQSDTARHIVRKIFDVESSSIDGQYVYDIETELGRFHAGVGELVCFNTDSVFDNFDTTHHKSRFHKVAYSMIVGGYVADRITEYLRSLNPYKPYNEQWTELEYEKVYLELMLLTKKRYVGSLYEFNPYKRSYIDKKGVALKRRDYCKYVHDVFKAVLKHIFDDDEPDTKIRIERARVAVVTAVEDLLANKIPFEKLILSKLLKGRYKIRDSTKANSFDATNIKIDDLVKWIDPELGECTGVVRAKHDYSIDSKNFFGQYDKQSKKRKLDAKKESELKDLDVWLKDTESGDMPENPEDMAFHLSYTQIKAKCGYEITIEKIMDPKTPEKDLEKVTQAHARLARKMMKRDPGSAPKSGVRLQFMFVQTKDLKAKQYERSEHPDYVKKHNLKPDMEYYVEKQLMKPMLQLFELWIGDPQSLFRESMIKYRNRQTGQTDISSFFKKK